MDCCMTHCPITKVNIRHFWLAVIVGFIFMYGYNYLIHGVLLTDLYAQTPQLWRTETDMQDKLWFVVLYQFLITLFTAFIFTRHYEGKGLAEGIRYGVLIGMLLGVAMAGQYAWLPVSLTLALTWFVAWFLQGLFLGVIYSVIYRA